MAFVSMIIVFAMLGLLIGGAFCAVLSVVGVIVFANMQKKGNRVGTPLLILSSVVLAGSIVACMIPCAFFVLVMLSGG